MRRYVFRLAILSLAVLGPTVARANDQEIAQQIVQKLQVEKQAGTLKGFSIDLSVDEGTVWLSGRVATPEQQHKALDIARRIRGVKQVVNDLMVVETAEVAAPTPATVAKPGQTFVANPTPSTIAKPKASGLSSLNQSSRSMFRSVSNVMRNAVQRVSPEADNSTVEQAAATEQTAVTEVAHTSPPPVAIGTGVAAATTVAAKPVATQPVAAQPIAATPQAVVPATPGYYGPQGYYNPQAYAHQAYYGPGYGYGYAPPAAHAAPRSQVPLAFAASRQVGHEGAVEGMPGGPVPMHLPGSGVGIAPARYDHPSMPGYAWPSYAAYPNYAAVTYPKQYSPTAWPYIGPFYPYPQVPLGWRKVTLEWDDGWWMLDFKDRRTMYNH